MSLGCGHEPLRVNEAESTACGECGDGCRSCWVGRIISRTANVELGPPPSAQIRVSSEALPEPQELVSDPEGRFRVCALRDYVRGSVGGEDGCYPRDRNVTFEVAIEAPRFLPLHSEVHWATSDPDETFSFIIDPR